MRCETVRKLLDAYVEGNLDSAKAHSLADHLHRCPECRKRWREVQKLLCLLDDAFADFCPIPSPTLKQSIEQKIAAQRSLVRHRVVALRSQAIFAVAAFVLIWFAANFAHQPFISQTADVRKVETPTEFAGVKKLMPPSQKLQKPQKQPKTVTVTTVKETTVKRQAIPLRRANVKVEVRKKFELPKAIARTSEKSEMQSREQISASYEPPTETLGKSQTQSRTVLIRIERVASLNPAEPTPEIFIHRALNAPAAQEVSVPFHQSAITLPVTVAEIPAPLPMQP